MEEIKDYFKMLIDRHSFGTYIGKNYTLDNFSAVKFSNDELTELIEIDPRLERFENDKYNCLRLSKEKHLLYYFSLGDYCYMTFLRDGRFDKRNKINTAFTPVLYIHDQFDELKEKVRELSEINFREYTFHFSPNVKDEL